MLKEPLLPPPPFTQINITNAYAPPAGGPSLDLFLRGSNTNNPPRQNYGMMDNPRLFGPAVSVGQGMVRMPAGSEASAFDVPSCRQRVPGHLDSSMCAATSGSGGGVVDARPRALSPPLSHRHDLSPRFLCEQQGSESEPSLLGERLSGAPTSTSTSTSTSTFLTPSTEALFGGPSRMEELCTAPGVKTEPQDAARNAFCADSRSLVGADSASSARSAMGTALDISRHLSSSVGCGGEALFGGGGGAGPSSLTHLLTAHSPDSVLDVPDSDAAYSVLPSPVHSHAQAPTPTLPDKRFEELRPVQQKLFPGQQAPRTAFDVLHNPAFFRDDAHHPGLPSSSRPRENTLAGLNLFGQQEAITGPHGPVPMRSEPPMAQHPGVGEAGSPWYGRCTSDCFQRPQGSQPYSNMYKQACNHSINITLTYN